MEIDPMENELDYPTEGKEKHTCYECESSNVILSKDERGDLEITCNNCGAFWWPEIEVNNNLKKPTTSRKLSDYEMLLSLLRGGFYLDNDNLIWGYVEGISINEIFPKEVSKRLLELYKA